MQVRKTHLLIKNMKLHILLYCINHVDPIKNITVEFQFENSFQWVINSNRLTKTMTLKF